MTRLRHQATPVIGAFYKNSVSQITHAVKKSPLKYKAKLL